MIPSCELQTKRKRIDAVLKRTRPFARRWGRVTKKIRAKRFIRKLECNVLKDHDSRVNKRVKSSAERVSNARRAYAERAPNALRMAPECASLPRTPEDIQMSRADGIQATGSLDLPGCNRRRSPSTAGRFDTLRMAGLA
jgi:hypothetical protein